VEIDQSIVIDQLVTAALRCFRCQAYDNVAAVCRREIPKCVNCTGEDGTKECVAPVEKTVNCVRKTG
jgi:hypothetical protein